jgi:hypothetical protein
MAAAQQRIAAGAALLLPPARARHIVFFVVLRAPSPSTPLRRLRFAGSNRFDARKPARNAPLRKRHDGVRDRSLRDAEDWPPRLGAGTGNVAGRERATTYAAVTYSPEC